MLTLDYVIDKLIFQYAFTLKNGTMSLQILTIHCLFGLLTNLDQQRFRSTKVELSTLSVTLEENCRLMNMAVV